MAVGSYAVYDADVVDGWFVPNAVSCEGKDIFLESGGQGLLHQPFGCSLQIFVVGMPGSGRCVEVADVSHLSASCDGA